MSTQSPIAVRESQWFSRKWKFQLLQTCLREFIQFLCECIVDALKRNLPSMRRHLVEKFCFVLHLLCLDTASWKQRKHVLASGKGLLLIKILTSPSISHLPWGGAPSLSSVIPCTTSCWPWNQLEKKKLPIIELSTIPYTRKCDSC